MILMYFVSGLAGSVQVIAGGLWSGNVPRKEPSEGREEGGGTMGYCTHQS